MFIVVRGNETLGKDYRLPTCPRFFNIYHPYDPIVSTVDENLVFVVLQIWVGTCRPYSVGTRSAEPWNFSFKSHCR